MSRPLIGIPMYSNINDPQRRRLNYSGTSTYSRALDLNGGLPVFIPLELDEQSLREIYTKLDGLLLSGGVDVHPQHYGEEVESFCGEIDPLRDATELTVTRWALADKKPVLAICRGVQMLNVASGGSLHQDIESQHPDPIAHRSVSHLETEAPHTIAIAPGSRLAHAVGTTTWVTNSYHHQALKHVPDYMHITARASDQIVEAVEGDDPSVYVLGVQFHPEMMVDDDARAHGIFRDFIGACQ
ncbi:MAG: gamma-glutamyl-gamma-aminobutyrate hydrolase family protein [Chloroflexi bacterium]|nr:gamma-glutamyl-gamma-aminobutyrate hydrolase family protein [Chloroflexota bacterium]